MSNDHDGVTDDGQEPVVGSPSDEAADAIGRGRRGPAAGPDRRRHRAAADDVTPEATRTSDATAAIWSPGPRTAGRLEPGDRRLGRAAARRSAARAGVSEAKGAATPKRAAATAVKRPNMFARFGRFLREVVAELRKVIWPTRNQMVTYTIVVIVFVVVHGRAGRRA